MHGHGNGKWNSIQRIVVCKKFGKSGRKIAGNYYLNYENIMTKTGEKDLGVTLTDNLNFGKHINHITGDT